MYVDDQNEDTRYFGRFTLDTGARDGLGPEALGEEFTASYFAQALRRSARRDGLAILMVGNDPLDALLYGDRAIVLSPGPSAHVAAIHALHPRPDATPDDLAATPLYEELEAALWDEGA